MAILTTLTKDADFDTLYNEDGTLAQPGTGVKIGRVKDDARLTVLQSNPKHGGHQHKAPSLGLTGEGYTIVCFNRTLCVQYFKQGGYTAFYGPVTLDQAKGLLTGTLKVKYIKGTTRFVVRPK